MAIVELHIFGNVYSVSCDDGQEKHLKELGIYLDRKVRSIADAIGHAASPDELHLMVVTALTIADELNDTTLEISELKNEIEALHSERDNQTSGNPAALAAYHKSLEAVAERIESIAEELEKV